MSPSHKQREIDLIVCPDCGLPDAVVENLDKLCDDPEHDNGEAVVRYVPARDPALSNLEAIASAAWRVRQMLHLNLSRIAAADDPVLNKNVVDAINDLNEHLPLSEDGWDWEAQ